MALVWCRTARLVATGSVFAVDLAVAVVVDSVITDFNRADGALANAPTTLPPEDRTDRAVGQVRVRAGAAGGAEVLGADVPVVTDVRADLTSVE